MLNILSVSHNVELNTTTMNGHNDGDGYKRRVVYEFGQPTMAVFQLRCLTKPMVSVDSTPSLSREC